jgi:hypothetical protein
MIQVFIINPTRLFHDSEGIPHENTDRRMLPFQRNGKADSGRTAERGLQEHGLHCGNGADRSQGCRHFQVCERTECIRSDRGHQVRENDGKIYARSADLPAAEKRDRLDIQRQDYGRENFERAAEENHGGKESKIILVTLHSKYFFVCFPIQSNV